jgi:hypothetical protein
MNSRAELCKLNIRVRKNALKTSSSAAREKTAVADIFKHYGIPAFNEAIGFAPGLRAAEVADAQRYDCADQKEDPCDEPIIEVPVLGTPLLDKRKTPVQRCRVTLVIPLLLLYNRLERRQSLVFRRVAEGFR